MKNSTKKYYQIRRIKRMTTINSITFNIQFIKFQFRENGNKTLSIRKCAKKLCNKRKKERNLRIIAIFLEI